MIVRERPPGEPDRVDGRAQVAGDEREVGGLDRDVRAGAEREPEVGLGERRRVVDAVADHRDDLALGLQAPRPRRPSRRVGPRRRRGRCRPRRRPRSAGLAPSPVRRTGVEPERPQLGDGLGARRLDRVANARAPRAAAVPARPRPAVAARRRRPSRPSTAPRTPMPGAARNPRRKAARRAPRARRAAIARATGCSLRPRPRRRGAAPRRASRRRAGATLVSSQRPSVTVPVLSSTIVVDPARPLEHLRPADQHAELRAAARCRPCSAVGVARPSAHGQAMISTATAAVNARRAPSRRARASRRASQRERDHDRHEDRRDAVGEPLHGRLARLGLLDEPRDLRERGVGADPRRAHGEPAVRVDRRAGDLAPGATSTGTGSPVSIDWSSAEAPSTTTPSVASFSPGRTTKTVADPQLLDRDVAPRRRREARARPSRRARASARMRRRERRLARASRYRPSRISVVTTAATSK